MTDMLNMYGDLVGYGKKANTKPGNFRPFQLPPLPDIRPKLVQPIGIKPTPVGKSVTPVNPAAANKPMYMAPAPVSAIVPPTVPAAISAPSMGMTDSPDNYNSMENYGFTSFNDPTRKNYLPLDINATSEPYNRLDDGSDFSNWKSGMTYSESLGNQDSWNQTIPDMDGFNSQMGGNALTYATDVTKENITGGWGDSVKDFFKGAVGSPDNPGWGKLALGTANSLVGGYLGMKQYGLAKDSFAEDMRRYNQDYAAQRTLTNADMRTRQEGRVFADPTHSMAVDAYMRQNEVK